jgi:2,4-dienoyl-CoA reductase-like NADH-dependent reductase (Old Yellow Enzyme family)/thioredoxin reductase
VSAKDDPTCGFAEHRNPGLLRWPAASLAVGWSTAFGPVHAMTAFPHLFSPLRIGSVVLRNRIFSAGHDTTLPTRGRVNRALVEYHRARAVGGAGLIIVQVAGVHESARYTSHILMVTDDGAVEGYRRLADACHSHGCAVFGQLFHPGREIMESQDGSLPIAYSASSVPTERFHVTPCPLSVGMIGEIVSGYGSGAARMRAAGLDGVEIVASHGYLPAQFLNPRVNLRADEYGGDPERRLRFLREAIAAVRAAAGPDFVVGLRISGDEFGGDGLRDDEVVRACVQLDADGSLDYLNVTAGSSATLAGSVHIVPPMTTANGYTVPLAAAIKRVTSMPVLVGGRINQPQEAERALAAGHADACGMTRALICDPELPAKAASGRLDEIRACVACNQACIGHFHLGYPISCIQHPETGRELRFGRRRRSVRPGRVMVVGGGPGGLKAAAVAAERGHAVTLYEGEARLGGQVRLAQLLPGRGEFGGIVANLEGEARRAGARIVTGTRVDLDLVRCEQPDAVVLATGARPRRLPFETEGAPRVLDAWQLLTATDLPGGTIAVVDWRCDWIGLGVAELLARRGRRVHLCVNGYMPGQRLQQYVRDTWLATVHRLGIDVVPLVRLVGVDEQTVYLEHTTAGDLVTLEDIDGVVLAHGHESVTELLRPLVDAAITVHAIGDCVAPRTVEEAVLEGLQAATSLERAPAAPAPA